MGTLEVGGLNTVKLGADCRKYSKQEKWTAEDRRANGQTPTWRLNGGEQRAELRERVGLGTRGIQVPTKEPGLFSPDTSPENIQLLQAQANLMYAHVCVKVET